MPPEERPQQCHLSQPPVTAACHSRLSQPPVTATGQEQPKARHRREATRQPEVDVATLSPRTRRREGKDTRAMRFGTRVSTDSPRKASGHRKPERGGQPAGPSSSPQQRVAAWGSAYYFSLS